MERNDTIARTIHDLGLAAWFGGSLMGATAVERAAAEVSEDEERLEIVDAAWRAWKPVQLAAIGAFAIGGAVLTFTNRSRVANQEGVAKLSLWKTGLAAATVATTMYAARLGRQLAEAEGTPVASGTTPSSETPDDIASKQRRLKMVQWAVPAEVAALIAMSATQGEQQRPENVLEGVFRRKVLRAA
jgi:uncharacterized membrane protein